MNSPIALFVYSRLNHLRRTIEALKENPEAAKSDLIIFSDAAKFSDMQKAVEDVRQYIRDISGFKSVSINLRPYNFGLARSIVDGVTQVLKKYNSVIVLEDDILTSSHFLKYMNQGLNRFIDDDRVISIHGYVYPINGKLPEAFFLRGADCWGWATWRRGWQLFESDGKLLLDGLKNQNLLKDFNFNNTLRYSDMLKAQIDGRNDSWAILWYASAFLANKLTLYPGRSLVQNIGNDSSGTHSSTSTDYDINLTHNPIDLSEVEIEHSRNSAKKFEHYFRSKRPLIKRFISIFYSKNIKSSLRAIANDWTSNFLKEKLRGLRKNNRSISFEGPFKTWDEAVQRSTGYDRKEIAEKILSSAIKVKNGEASYERDSVIFNEIQYSRPITATLTWSAAINDDHLSVLDFGGSLGTSYFQNKIFFKEFSNTSWSIIEQQHIVDLGRKYIQCENLKFYNSIEECTKNERPNVAILSSVLQYLEKPFEVLSKIMSLDIDLIVLDRTPFLNSFGSDQIKIQITPSSIYSAIYPIRLFNKNNLLEIIKSHGYKVHAEFNSLDRLDHTATWKGMIIKQV
tara:strand:- start:15097 stop:16803 length:1707 start_codon:yes stop_codon:yes gene_type:complete